MKKISIFFIMIIIMFALSGCNNNSNTKNQNNNSSSSEQTDNTATNKISYERLSENKKTEEPISNFTTTIYDADEERQTNMTLACNTLSGTVVKSGETFSFNETLGRAKPEDGYEKAEVFESDGDIIHEYGGGKCQISSTLYNAVLAVPNLTVIERHAHSRKVLYVEERKRCCCCLWKRRF